MARTSGRTFAIIPFFARLLLSDNGRPAKNDQSEAEGALDVVDLGGALPGELLLGAPEVAVGGRALVDGLAQVEVADDRRRPQVDDLLHGAADLQRVDGLSAEGLHHHRYRPGDADCVGHLDLAAA